MKPAATQAGWAGATVEVDAAQPTEASSVDLEPEHGARFVLEREPEGSYVARAFVAGGACGDGRATLQADGRWEVTGQWPEAWVEAEIRKLLRVLRDEPRARLVRWRPRPSP